jgi:hypothetical protein
VVVGELRHAAPFRAAGDGDGEACTEHHHWAPHLLHVLVDVEQQVVRSWC